MRIRRSRQAQADANALWAYVAQHNVAAADRLIERIVSATDRLLLHPESGSPKFEIYPGLRSVPSFPYLIYYRVAEGVIEVLHLRHGARKPPGNIDDLR